MILSDKSTQVALDTVRRGISHIPRWDVGDPGLYSPAAMFSKPHQDAPESNITERQMVRSKNRQEGPG